MNVRVISNNLNGFLYFDVRDICKNNNFDNILPDEDVKTIYIYHFQFLNPYKPCKFCNHFGFLNKLSTNIDHKPCVYKGGPITNDYESESGELIYDKSECEDIYDKGGYDVDVSDISVIEDDQPARKRYLKRKSTSSNKDYLDESKRKKRQLVLSIGSSFKCDTETNQSLEETRISAEDFKEREDRLKVRSEIEVQIMKDMIEKVENTCPDSIIKNKPVYYRNHSQHSWVTRSKIIALILHPFFHLYNEKYSSQVYQIREGTIQSWLYRENKVRKWIVIIRKLETGDLFEILPPKDREMYIKR